MLDKHVTRGTKKDKVVSEVLGEEHALSPSDVLNHDFRRLSFGGYDRAEVDAFLERVADALEELILEVRLLKERNEEQRKALDEYRDLENSLRNALISSQRFGEEVLEAAKREAHVILEEARLKKAQAQLEMGRVPNSLARDIHVLEQQRSRMRLELLAILETHRRLLDSLIPEDSMRTPTSVFEVGADSDDGGSRRQIEAAAVPAARSPGDDSKPLAAAAGSNRQGSPGAISEHLDDSAGAVSADKEKRE
jgi:cell division initiation protein